MSNMLKVELDFLCRMVYTEPNVRCALNNIINSCCCNEIEIMENDNPVKDKLKTIINQQYKKFFKSAIISALSTGFVCFTIKKRDGINMPECLPLGSFVWCCISTDRLKPHLRERQGLIGYDVSHQLSNVSNTRIFVVAFEDPVCLMNSAHLVTPMFGLVQKYRDMLTAIESSIAGNAWNSSKHLVFSEKIDLKDQTTTGIQLLDEQRRYHLTGQYNQMFHNNLMRLQDRDGYWQHSVQTGLDYHIRSEFSDDKHEQVSVGSKRACCHVMPPNIDVQELNPVNTISDVDSVQQRFAEDVRAYFNLNSRAFGKSQFSASIEAMTEDQYRQHKQMCKFLEDLSAYAYSKCFDVEPSNVKFTVTPVTKIDLTEPENVKKLADAEVLSEGNKSVMRKKLKISEDQNLKNK